uniref:Uncharacterized protein n=1 Tax=Aureoumbra lagunensis TaxID=44058 RepID=A0A7S3K476_9STRA|mmetsp:Transcript_12228/g.16529  ORF Transcript_12228/g.16529 Transcript_12228/m.16529 type:complete len:134 (+) Transcript_12228:47-448(+)
MTFEFTGNVPVGEIAPCELLGFNSDEKNVRESVQAFGGKKLYFPNIPLEKQEEETVIEERIIRLKYAGATMKITLKGASLKKSLAWLLQKFFSWYEQKKGQNLTNLKFQDYPSSALICNVPNTLLLVLDDGEN